MKTLTIIRFKPKPQYYDRFRASLSRAVESLDHYVCERDDEIFQVFVSSGIEQVSDFQDPAVTWLDKKKFMLQEYSLEEGHTRPITTFVHQEPDNGKL